MKNLIFILNLMIFSNSFAEYGRKNYDLNYIEQTLQTLGDRQDETKEKPYFEASAKAEKRNKGQVTCPDGSKASIRCGKWESAVCMCGWQGTNKGYFGPANCGCF